MLMLKLYTKLANMRKSLRDERGQDMVEYAIMTGMIAAAAITSITTIAGWVVTKFSTLAGTLSGTTPGA